MKIGAQLYTVRAFTQSIEDFTRTIEKIAAIGYKYVQISGIGAISAQVVADICKAHGLEIVITHTAPARVKDDTANVINEHKLMGAKYIGIGMMPNEYARTAAGVQQFIADFTPAAQQIKEAGLTFMYHNHAFEFEKYDGKRMMDILIDDFPLCGFTLDTYWVQAGGGDPAAWIRKLNHRVPVIHIKDMSYYQDQQRMSEIGEGNLNWAEIFTACEDAGVIYALVEQDDCYGADPFACLQKSLENINNGGMG
jgi:sugar phosphate isomerase/epimerase